MGRFCQIKNPKLNIISLNYPWKFDVIPKKTLSYDLIIGRDLMKELQMDVFCSEDGIRLPMQKTQNGKWTDLNLMDQ